MSIDETCRLDIDDILSPQSAADDLSLPPAQPLACARSLSAKAKVQPVGLRRSGVSDLIGQLDMLPDVGLAPPPLPLLRAQPLAPEPAPWAASSTIPALATPTSPGTPAARVSSKGEALVLAALDRLEVGIHRDRGGLAFMEDESSVLQQQGTLALVGVYDGHCGAAAAQLLRDRLLSSIADHLLGAGDDAKDTLGGRSGSWRDLGSSSSSSSPSPLDQDDAAACRALVAGFQACEAALTAGQTASGATAIVLMLQSGGQALNVAWCGDCRAVLSRRGKPVVLTTDHTTKSPRELARVHRAGAEILDGRLGGFLQVTRAFGDGLPSDDPAAAAAVVGREELTCSSLAERPSETSVIPMEPDLASAPFLDAQLSRATTMDATTMDAATTDAATMDAATSCPSPAGWSKVAGLTALPELASETLRADDEFVILASDGLWDVLTPAEAIKAARSELRAYDDAGMAAEKLVELALRRHSDDNITVAIVRLFAPRPEESVARSFAARRPGGKRLVGTGGPMPNSFLQLTKVDDSFVRVVGGF